MESHGIVRVVPASALGLAYRDSAIRADQIVTQARIAVITAPDDGFARTIREVKERRRDTQPLMLPSGGSTFTNPPKDKAWRLLDEAGMRGESEGYAQYSEQHANFIINKGGASAQDIEALIARGKRAVQDRAGVTLREEVCRLTPDGWASDGERKQ